MPTEFKQLQADLKALQPFLQFTDDGLFGLVKYCFSDVSVLPDVGAAGTGNLGVTVNFSDRLHKVSSTIGTLREYFHGDTSSV
ncbi:MAG: hypothetical protein PHN84_07890 [Desulfuromonadaceae bacterium]|nr:hypothetical protein [Desulfuromonadaceae bacterium]MDD2854752.1 hypothetical protein [Desulfuromonadaceae bacterium]